MQVPVSYSISGQQLWLSPLKALFWENELTLIVSDLHFGKTGHFRKSGIGVPQHVFRNDLQRLFSLIQYFQPQRLLVVGDFFHSSLNKEADLFGKWRNDHHSLEIILVQGNHDIFPESWYKVNEVTMHNEVFTSGPFSFVHEWQDEFEEQAETYYFSGHIHPAVRINGSGRQSMRLPCFYFGNNQAILPAFGGFTGMATIDPEKNSKVFVIADKQVLLLQ